VTSLRRLNHVGLKVFKEWLDSHRGIIGESVPEVLLKGPELTELVPGGADVSRAIKFTTKRQAGIFLHELLDPLQLEDIHADAGLWSWLAVRFFDELAAQSGGKRKVLAHAHYLFDPHNSKRRYRHLLHTPFQLVSELPDYNRIFLDADVKIHGDLMEQTMGRLYLMRLPGVRAAIERLYLDEATGRMKRGAMSSGNTKRGDLRHRLPVRIRQLEKTYDLAALDGERLVALLGPEFEVWR